ncbi:MAG: hypothetical protein WCS73_13155 [Lentisphaeria bacterium]
MKRVVKICTAIALMGTMAFSADVAKKVNPAVEPEVKVAQDKLLPLVSMEQAFARALNTRNALLEFIEKQSAQLKNLKGDEFVATQKKVEDAKKALRQSTTYMDVIYGLGGKRNYQYNNVTSTIYLRVGTVTEVFARAIQTRDVLAKQVVDLKAKVEKEADAAKKATLQKQYDAVAGNWALVVNALYNVFQIHPKRQYEFDPTKNMLFLKTNDAEINKLKADLAKEKEESAAKDKPEPEKNK